MSLGWRRSTDGTRRSREMRAGARKLGSDAPVPGDEVREQLKTGAVALFGVELHGEDISAGNRASKRRRIGDGRGRHTRVVGCRVVAVREVEPRAVIDAVPQRMLLLATDRAPAHMRHLQPAAAAIDHRRVAKAHDTACENTQAGSGSFLAVFEEHLQAEADPQERTVRADL